MQGQNLISLQHTFDTFAIYVAVSKIHASCFICQCCSSCQISSMLQNPALWSNTEILNRKHNGNKEDKCSKIGMWQEHEYMKKKIPHSKFHWNSLDFSHVEFRTEKEPPSTLMWTLFFLAQVQSHSTFKLLAVSSFFLNFLSFCYNSALRQAEPLWDCFN